MGADCSDCNGAGCNRYFYAIVSTWVFVSRVSSWTHHTQMCVSRVCDQIFRHSGKRKRQARTAASTLTRRKRRAEYRCAGTPVKSPSAFLVLVRKELWQAK